MDLIIFNGNVLTMDADYPRAEAVAIKDGKIAGAGSNEDILKLRSENTDIIDAGANTVLPGFNDSHLHLYGYAMTKNRVDISNLPSIEALQDKLRSHIRDGDLNNDAWIIGRGWDQTPYPEQKMPNRHDLDEVSTKHPIMLIRKCGHVCVLNTAALKAADIYKQPPVVEGGLIELDADGEPTGILKENAMNLVKTPAQNISPDAVKARIMSAAMDFVKAGLTSVQTDDVGSFPGNPSDLFNAYLQLAANDQLPLRVNEQMLLPEPDDLKQVIESGWITGCGNDYFKIGPLKILTDGSFGGRSALLSEPYSDDPGNYGIALYTKEQLKELVVIAHTTNMQVAAHAIGDQSITDILDVYHEVQQDYPRDNVRFRIIHASLTPPVLLDRFKEQEILADVQPRFMPSDLPFIESRLGKKRASSAYCFKEFIKRGIPIGGSSDCPVEDYRPLSGIHAAVMRQGDDGEPKEGWMPEQKLTLHEALYIYTMGSAYNSFEEDIKGSITIGKLADLVILSDNIENISSDKIKDLSMEKTIVGGKIVFSS